MNTQQKQQPDQPGIGNRPFIIMVDEAWIPTDEQKRQIVEEFNETLQGSYQTR